MNVGHDCCVLLFSADSPLRITVPELAHFTKLPPCKLLCAPFHIPCKKKGKKDRGKKCRAYLQLQLHLCLPTKHAVKAILIMPNNVWHWQDTQDMPPFVIFKSGRGGGGRRGLQ